MDEVENISDDGWIALLNDLATVEPMSISAEAHKISQFDNEVFFNDNGNPTDRFLEALKQDFGKLPDVSLAEYSEVANEIVEKEKRLGKKANLRNHELIGRKKNEKSGGYLSEEEKEADLEEIERLVTQSGYHTTGHTRSKQHLKKKVTLNHNTSNDDLSNDEVEEDINKYIDSTTKKYKPPKATNNNKKMSLSTKPSKSSEMSVIAQQRHTKAPSSTSSFSDQKTYKSKLQREYQEVSTSLADDDDDEEDDEEVECHNKKGVNLIKAKPSSSSLDEEKKGKKENRKESKENGKQIIKSSITDNANTNTNAIYNMKGKHCSSTTNIPDYMQPTTSSTTHTSSYSNNDTIFNTELHELEQESEKDQKVKSLQLRITGQLQTIKSLELQLSSTMELLNQRNKQLVGYENKYKSFLTNQKRMISQQTKSETYQIEANHYQELIKQYQQEIITLQSKLQQEKILHYRNEERNKVFREAIERMKVSYMVSYHFIVLVR